MSRWTQTPGQSKPMCEAMKRPAQELGLLSRSWGHRRTDGDPSPHSNGVGERGSTKNAIRAASVWAHCGHPTPLDLPRHPQPSPSLMSARRGLGGGPSAGRQLRGTWDPEGLVCGLRGLPPPREAASERTDRGQQTDPSGEEPWYPPRWTCWQGAQREVHPSLGHPPASTDLGPRWGDPGLRAAVSWDDTASLSAGLSLFCTTGCGCLARPTATEFFISATAEVNSLKCSSGQ